MIPAVRDEEWYNRKNGELVNGEYYKISPKDFPELNNFDRYYENEFVPLYNELIWIEKKKIGKIKGITEDLIEKKDNINAKALEAHKIIFAALEHPDSTNRKVLKIINAKQKKLNEAVGELKKIFEDYNYLKPGNSSLKRPRETSGGGNENHPKKPKSKGHCEICDDISKTMDSELGIILCDKTCQFLYYISLQ
jgi:hypothetical protein